MPERDAIAIGAPCWIDLWTSDVEAARRFYAELFGWVAEEANPDFGGYFMFTQQGHPVAGAMGSMPDRPASKHLEGLLRHRRCRSGARCGQIGRGGKRARGVSCR